MQGVEVKVLTDAIYAEFSGSSVSSLVGGRMFEDFAPPRTEYPYIVYSIITSVKDKTFTEEFKDTTVQFSIFSTSSSSSEIKEIYKGVSELYDECSLHLSEGTLLRMHEVNLVPMPVENTGSPNAPLLCRHYAVDFEILTEN